MEIAQFWSMERVLLQGASRWRVTRWPEMTELISGEGEATPEPGGNRLAVREVSGRIHIVGDSEAVEVCLPADAKPPQAVAWDETDALLVIAGASALNPPHATLSSLLPIPPTGCTAQPFGSIPATGMRLWQLPLDGSDPGCLMQVGGAERIGRTAGGPAGLSGKRIAITYSSIPVYGRTDTRRVRYWDPSQGEASSGRDLFPPLPGTTSDCVPSPDGRRLAFLHSDIEPAFPFWYRLAISSSEPESRVTYPLPPEMRLVGQAPVWSPDGHFVAVCAFQGIRVEMIVVDTESGGWESLGAADGVYSRVALAPGGREALALWESPSTPRVLHRVSAAGRTPLSSPSEESDPMGGAQGIDVRLVRWRNDEAALEGVLVVPKGAGPYPLVVDLHGGPINWPGFAYEPNLLRWCRAGFAAFAPDYRASGIAGREAMLASHRCQDVPPGLSSAYDVLAGVEAMVATGLVDPDRLYLFGHSAGGHLVNRIVTVDHRFRAAVCWEGPADVQLPFCLAGGGGGLAYARAMLGGNPWQAPERYRADSALAHVEDVRTPLLLLFGDHNGALFPLADAIVWYTALREHGVEADLIIYRGEGHLMARPENQQDLYARSVTWFQAH